MSIKKATPKAVFSACEQLERLEQSWNRDDVRLAVGGGSFSVIDPLIQAWRKLQPVREVAPSLPTELLIQIAILLEQKVSTYIEEVESRDQVREAALVAANEETAENLLRIETAMSEQLEQSQQANHELEAEHARLEHELDNKSQALLASELKLQVSGEGILSLKQRLEEQKVFYELAITQQKQAQLDDSTRLAELHQQQLMQLKTETKQQLTQQKAELSQAAQLAEDRLMRLLDKGRSELNELQLITSNKLEVASREQQADKQLISQQKLELNALETSLSQVAQQAKEQIKEQALNLEAKISLLKSEKSNLNQQLLEHKTRGSEQEKTDLQQLKDSISLLQKQISN